MNKVSPWLWSKRTLVALVALSAFGAFFSSCAKKSTGHPTRSDVPIICRLEASANTSERGRIRLVIDLENTAPVAHRLLSPAEGSNLNIFYRKRNDSILSFNSLLLPTDGAFGLKVIHLPPAGKVSREVTLGMPPGNYEIFAEYVSRPANEVTWLGKTQSSTNFLQVPR